MDKRRPFSVSQSTRAGGARQPEPVRRQPAETSPSEPAIPQSEPKPEPKSEPSANVSRREAKRAEKDRKPRRHWRFKSFVGLVVVLLAGAIAFVVIHRADVPVDTSKYQAVSTVDGKIYFGKLHVINSHYIELDDAAYYVSPDSGSTSKDDSTKLDTVQQDRNSVNVLTNKFYNPAGSVIISRDKVVSYENLNPDGRVAQWLKQQNN